MNNGQYFWKVLEGIIGKFEHIRLKPTDRYSYS